MSLGPVIFGMVLITASFIIQSVLQKKFEQKLSVIKFVFLSITVLVTVLVTGLGVACILTGAITLSDKSVYQTMIIASLINLGLFIYVAKNK